eukprot:7310809-Prymnesium_polylepis.1
MVVQVDSHDARGRPHRGASSRTLWAYASVRSSGRTGWRWRGGALVARRVCSAVANVGATIFGCAVVGDDGHAVECKVQFAPHALSPAEWARAAWRAAWRVATQKDKATLRAPRDGEKGAWVRSCAHLERNACGPCTHWYSSSRSGLSAGSMRDAALLESRCSMLTRLCTAVHAGATLVPRAGVCGDLPVPPSALHLVEWPRADRSKRNSPSFLQTLFEA